MMITKIQMRSFNEVQELLYAAKQLMNDAYIHSEQHGVYTMTDAKAAEDVLELDFSQPVSLVSENNWIHKQVRQFAVH